MRALVAKCLAPAARADQLNCLAAANKPFDMDCEALGARFEVMSRLGRLLPGSHTAGVDFHLCSDEEALKRACFQVMCHPWKIEFAKSGHVLEGAACTFQQLVRHMSVQEGLSKRSSSMMSHASHPMVKKRAMTMTRAI